MRDMSSKGRAIIDVQKIILTTEVLTAEEFSLEQQEVIINALLGLLSTIENNQLFVIDYHSVVNVTSEVEDSGIFNDMEFQYFKDNALEICSTLAWAIFDLGCTAGEYTLTDLDVDHIRISYREDNPWVTM